MALQYRTVLTAFQPAKEILDPELFAGRRHQIEKGCGLLLTKQHIFIHGVRGIGKSSLARQLELIASGDKRLLSDIDAFEAESFDYATVFITRDDSINNINSLLYRALSGPEGFLQWESILGLDSVGAYDLEGSLNPKLVTEFWRRAERAAQLAADGLAIFIDEFDRIENQSGFSSLIKSSPGNCVFVITGIAETEKALVKDHASISRELNDGTLPVPQMTESELDEIVARAECHLDNEIRFASSTRSRLVKLAKGHPYLLHLVGKNAVSIAFRAKSSVVDAQILEQAIDEASRGEAGFLEDRYLIAIGSSAQREQMLRVIAESDKDTVHTSEVYPEAQVMGVTNPSYYVGDLQKKQYGEEVVKISEQYYAIRDPLFRAYVAATKARLSGFVDEEGRQLRKDKCRILQLSDLHFGEFHYFSKLPLHQDVIPEDDRPSLGRYINQAIRQIEAFENGIDVVAISGDLTSKGTTTEFDLAAEFILSLLADIEAFQGSRPHLVVVPGNHDVNWTLAEADKGLLGAGFLPFLNFLSKVGLSSSTNPIPPERLYFVHSFPDAGVEILALNSALLESKDDHRGYIGESQLTNAFGELSAADDLVRVAILHHHVVQVPSIEDGIQKPDEVLRDAAFVKQSLMETKFSLALHGHRHRGHEELVQNPQGRSLVIIGCGSSAVVNPARGSTPLQMNLLTVSKEQVSFQGFAFDTGRRKWIPSNDRAGEFAIS